MVVQKRAEMIASLLHKIGRENISDSNLCTVTLGKSAICEESPSMNIVFLKLGHVRKGPYLQRNDNFVDERLGKSR